MLRSLIYSLAGRKSFNKMKLIAISAPNNRVCSDEDEQRLDRKVEQFGTAKRIDQFYALK